MKKIILQLFVAVSLMLLANSGWGYLLADGVTDVGVFDTFIVGTNDLSAYTVNDNNGSGEGTELLWVRDMLNDPTLSYTQVDEGYEELDLSGEIYSLEGYDAESGFAFQLNSEVEYFLVKWGNGGKADGDNLDLVKWTLWENSDSKIWAVINILDSGLADDGWEIKNIGAFSHYGEVGGSTPVPEPSTVLLVGIGLSGLVLAGRRRKSLQDPPVQ